jgi:hypothetical protein
MFCNVIVFMICTNGHVDFEQWLGQVDSRRFVSLCVVRPLKTKSEKEEKPCK